MPIELWNDEDYTEEEQLELARRLVGLTVVREIL